MHRFSLPFFPHAVACGCAGLLLLLAVGPAHAQSLRVESLAPGVHRIWGSADGGILVLEDGDRLVLVDAQTQAAAAAVDSALAVLGDAPVRLVVNTHYHADHLEGNARFRSAGAVTAAHRNVPAQALKDTVVADWGGWHRTPASPDALPSLLVDSTLTVRFGNSSAHFVHLPHAHTDGDLGAWLPDQNLVLLGDVLEIDAAPFIDWWAGGTLDGMIRACDWALGLGDGGTRYVPGHGPIIDRAAMTAYRDMLADLRRSTLSLLATHPTWEAFRDAGITQTYADQLGGERRARHLAALLYLGLASDDVQTTNDE